MVMMSSTYLGTSPDLLRKRLRILTDLFLINLLGESIITSSQIVEILGFALHHHYSEKDCKFREIYTAAQPVLVW